MTLREKINTAILATALAYTSLVNADKPPASAEQHYQYSRQQCEAEGVSREFCDYMIEQQNKTRQEDSNLTTIIGAINGKECLHTQELVLHFDYPQAAGVSALFGSSPEREFMRMLRSKGYNQVSMGEPIMGIKDGNYFFRGAESTSSVRPDIPHLYVHYTARGPEGITYEVMIAKRKTVYVDRAITYQSQGAHSETLSLGNGEIKVDREKNTRNFTRQKIEDGIPQSCGISSSRPSGCPPCPPCEEKKGNERRQ